MTWPPEQLQPQQQWSDKETMCCANLSRAAYGLGPAGITLREMPQLSILRVCVCVCVSVSVCVCFLIQYMLHSEHQNMGSEDIL